LDDVEGESFRGDVAFADLAKDVQNFAPEVGRRKTSNKPKRRFGMMKILFYLG
jgi:hypothetical protein